VLTKLEKINFSVAIVGLLVNVIALAGIFFGFAQSGGTEAAWSPAFLTAATFFVLVYSLIGIHYGIRHMAVLRWKELGYYKGEEQRESTLVRIAFLLSAPSLLLWTISNLQLYESPSFGSVVIVLVTFFGLFLSTFMLSDITANLHRPGALVEPRLRRDLSTPNLSGSSRR
jgi:hypothetical protein